MASHVVTGTRFSQTESDIDILADGNYFFVDKTLTIHKFLTGPQHQLILRPRRCGKSHAISLLRAFLEAPSPDEARPAELETPFKGTLIDGDSYKDLVKEHYKAYPILYMDLKDVNGLSLQEMCQRFHSKLRNPLKFCRDELKRRKKDGMPLYNRLCQLIDQQGRSKILSSTLLYLSEALHVIYKRRAIVLIDEYDAPLNHALEHKYLSPASMFFGKMFSSLLKDNPHVERCFMVGILKLGKAAWLSGLNNVEVFPLNAEDPHYGDSFLFTVEEVQEFLVKAKSTLQLSDLKKYYNSYYARGPDGTSISLFNPWSIHHAIAKGRLSCYWNQTSNYVPIRKAIWNREPDFTNRLTELLAGKEVKLPIRDMVTYENLNDIEERDLWGLLSYAGYLTPVFADGSPSSHYCIPNFEVHQEWVSWLQEFVEEKEQKSFEDIKTLLNPLLQGDAVEAQKALSKLLLEHFSYFLSGASHPEKVYQALLFGLLLSEFGRRPGSYVVKMEKEAGYGRYDIRCWPTLQDHQTEIIIELKAVSLTKKNRNKNRVKKAKEELEKHMNQQLKNAMDQLESREYYRDSRDYVTTVHEFGICFAGKLCVVGSRTRTRDETDWTVNNTTIPAAQFQQSEVDEQPFDAIVEEKLEERDEPTGGTSSKKRKTGQQGDGDTGSSKTSSPDPSKRSRLE